VNARVSGRSVDEVAWSVDACVRSAEDAIRTVDVLVRTDDDATPNVTRSNLTRHLAAGTGHVAIAFMREWRALVAEHEAQFAEHGLPAGHAKRLTQAAGDLRLAINARGLQQGKRTAATSGAREVTREVTREALRQLRIVSSLVVPKQAPNAEWMAAWRTATVVARQGTRAGGGESAGAVALETAEVKAA